MKLFFILFVLLTNVLQPLYKNPSAPTEVRVADLLSRMTLEEKIMQLSQSYMDRNDNENNVAAQLEKTPPEIGSMISYSFDSRVSNALQKRAMEETRLGIPILFGYDAIHGFRTCFPIPLAQAASFNTALAFEACRINASEAYAGGIDWVFSPMVDIARDARWGRNMEGYGEDPYLTSRFCETAVRAYQGEDPSRPGYVAACMKHYAGYGASEAGRDYTAVDISRQTLWDTWLPPYEAGVRAGAMSAMSAFNTLNGIPASADRYLLTEVFKRKWNCDGFIVTDWGTTEQLVLQGFAADEKQAAKMALEAGVDMDMCDMVFHRHLAGLVKEGSVSMKTIDDAVRRILRIKFRLGLFDNPYRPETEAERDYLLPEYLDVSEKLAQECAVLLKNEGDVLPLDKNCKVLLTGPVACDSDAHLGNWRGHTLAEETTDIRTAMEKEFPRLVYRAGCSYETAGRKELNRARRAARRVGTVVVCLGEQAKWSGENKTRASIALPEAQEAFLRAMRKAGKKIVVLIETGRAVDLTRIEPLADALMVTWHLGNCEGQAVSGLLSGRYNPSGRLPVTFPWTTGQVPIYYNARALCRRGKWGQYIDGTPLEPAYPFGHGLSYSCFEYSDIHLDGLKATVTVTNRSDVGGKETVLWFITDKACSIVARPVRELRHFEKKYLAPGESYEFVFEMDKLKDLGYINHEGERFFEPGEFILYAGDKSLEFRVD